MLHSSFPVSAPTGAMAGACAFTVAEPAAWFCAYATLVVDQRRVLLHHFAAFDRLERWRGCTHRVLLRNLYADIGITVVDHHAVTWLARREDREFARRASWGELVGKADAWITATAPCFLAALAELGAEPVGPTNLPLAA